LRRPAGQRRIALPSAAADRQDALLAAFFAALRCFAVSMRLLTAEAPSAGALAAFASERLSAPFLPAPLFAVVPGLPTSFGFAGPLVAGDCAKLSESGMQSANVAIERAARLLIMIVVSLRA